MKKGNLSKNTRRKQLDSLLDSLDEKGLTI
ncbi:hypothetical protein HYG84_15440 [Alkaliphilus sp. B6464]|nr:hypothetical protein HYG84_15440 [Alkaliphilus sp. B6464]